MKKSKVMWSVLITIVIVVGLLYGLNSKTKDISSNIEEKNSNETATVEKTTISVDEPPIEAIMVESNQSETDSIILTENKKKAVQGSVEIEVNFYPDKGENWVFNVYLDTHSVDLTDLDLSKYVTFYGNIEVNQKNGLMFTSTGEGHHVQKTIRIPKIIDGVPTLDLDTKEISLVILPIDGKESSELIWIQKN
jgi:hypothetical protein